MSMGEESAGSALSPRTASVVQALLTVGIAAVVLLLGRLALVVAFWPFPANATSVLSVFLEWSVLIWILLVAAITVWRAADPPRTRARLYIAAAAIGAVAGLVIWVVPVIAAMGTDVLFLVLPQSTIRIGILVVAGAIGALAAAGILRSRAPAQAR